MTSSLRRFISLSLVITGSLLGGCADHTPTSTVAVTPAVSGAYATIQPADMRVVARAFAQALADPQLRRHVGRALRDSKYSEHKVRLGTLLAMPQSGRLLTEMARLSGSQSGELLALIRTLPDLQLFVPVQTHRRTWNGDGDVYVASLLSRTTFVAFDTSGAERALSPDVAPEKTTFVLLPIENANWADPAVAVQTNTQTSEVSLDEGTGCSEYAIIECGGQTGGGGGGAPPGTPVVPAARPSGVYIVSVHLLDVGEPWFRGDPEVELHIVGPGSSSTNINEVYSQECHYHDDNYGHLAVPDNARDGFDVNGHYWNGAVQISPQSATSPAYTSSDSAGNYQLQFWEDDQTGCVILADAITWRKFFRDQAWLVVSYIFYRAAYSIDHTRCASECKVATWALFGLGSAVHVLLAAGTSSDDPLGMLVPNEEAAAKGVFVEANTTHSILRPTDSGFAVNGAVRLVIHNTGTDTY